MQPLPSKGWSRLALSAVAILAVAGCSTSAISAPPSTPPTNPSATPVAAPVATAAAPSATVAASTAAQTCAKPKLIVGAIHVGSILDAGYNEAEHDGLMEMIANVPCIKLTEAENVPEGPNVVPVMEEMIQVEGAKLIFPQSYGYQDFALQVAGAHPDVVFEHPSGYKQAKNFGTYWGGSVDLMYVEGIAAAMTTKSNKLGFVGAMPIPQTIAAIDAFELGAQTINPNVTTTVIWINTWADAGKETAATNTLVSQGVDVVTSIVDSPVGVVQTAEKAGIWSIGYHSATVAKFAPQHWLTGLDFNFGPAFTKMAQDVIAGTWTAQNLMEPLSAGMVKLAPFGANVPQTVQTAVTKAAADAAAPGFVFLKGPISDQAGTVRIAAGATTDITQWGNAVDWFVKGVIGQPK